MARNRGNCAALPTNECRRLRRDKLRYTEEEHVTEHEEKLRPAEVATRIGLAPSTLRLYSVRFAALLSPGAANPPPSADGRPGHRTYTRADVAVLQRAKALLDDGLTYDEALAALAPNHLAAGGDLASTSAELRVYLEAFQQAVDAWRALAEERGREIGELRARIDELEAALTEATRPLVVEQAPQPTRRSWLGRLLARLSGAEATL